MRLAILAMSNFVMATPSLSGDYDRLDAFVRKGMQEVGIPGVAVAVVKNGDIVHVKGYGESSPGVPITPQTPFWLGSLSKSFTAMAIMQLVEAGKIDLDNPVKTYVPNLRFADEDIAGRITVRQLLNHTSGFSTISGRKQFFARGTGQEALERGARENAGERSKAVPGEKFQYSDVNFNIASLIVSEVSGVPFDRYVRERIFAPLKMAESFTDLDEAHTHGLTTGYRYWFGYPVAAHDMPYSHEVLGSGGLFSSAADLARYALANQGDESGRNVLSPAGFAAMHTPGAQIATDIDYGLGWVIERKSGERVVRHAGDMECSHAEIMMAPEERIGVVVLMNANSPSQIVRLIEICEGAFSIARGKEPKKLENDPVPSMLLYTILTILVIQLLVAALFVRKFVRWKRRPETLPKRRKLMAGLFVSIVANLAIAATIFVALPTAFEIPYLSVSLFMPDAFWVMTASGGFALIWMLVRIVSILRICRSARPESTAMPEFEMQQG